MSDFNINSIYLVSTANNTFIARYYGGGSSTLIFIGQDGKYIFCEYVYIVEYTKLSSYTYDVGELC